MDPIGYINLYVIYIYIIYIDSLEVGAMVFFWKPPHFLGFSTSSEASCTATQTPLQAPEPMAARVRKPPLQNRLTAVRSES